MVGWGISQHYRYDCEKFMANVLVLGASGQIARYAFPASPLRIVRTMSFDAANFYTPSLVLADTTFGTSQTLAGSDDPYFQGEKKSGHSPTFVKHPCQRRQSRRSFATMRSTCTEQEHSRQHPEKGHTNGRNPVDCTARKQ